MLDDYKRALAASETRFRNLIEKAADGVLVVGDDGVICYVNPAAETLLGRRAGDLIGQMFGRPLAPGETTEIDLCPAPRPEDQPDGGYPPYAVAEMRVAEIDWDGRPAFLATLRDISARKRADAALRFLADASIVLAGSLDSTTTLASVARLAVLHLADWCIIDLLDGTDSVRRVAADHGDPQREELAGRLRGLFPLAPCSGGALDAALHHGQLHVSNAAMNAPAAELVLAPSQEEIVRQLGCKAVMIVPMTARGRTIGAISFVSTAPGRSYDLHEQALARDLASRAAVALDNAQLFDQTQEALRRRDEFLAMLAHELRNPLAPILNAAHLMRLHGLADPDLERARAIIERQGGHLAHLLDDLLDLSRITHGKIELRKQIVDVGTVVADAVQSSRSLIEGRSHHLAIAVEDRPLRVEGDPTRLAQIIVNLLNNAARYTAPGGRIELSAGAEDAHVVLCVKDTGAGIPRTRLASIFEPFTQLEPSLDRSMGGLGIGLALVRELVALHGGTVAAHSDGPGQGSEFVVRLPLISHTKEMPTPQKPPPFVHRRILLIEDNHDGREMLANLLRLWGHEVEETSDGARGLDMILRQRPDVALVDIGLPGLDGYELARRVRAAAGGGAVRLIAVTGYGQPEDRRRATEAGFNGHLVKPVDLDRLARILADLPR